MSFIHAVPGDKVGKKVWYVGMKEPAVVTSWKTVGPVVTHLYRFFTPVRFGFDDGQVLDTVAVTSGPVGKGTP